MKNKTDWWFIGVVVVIVASLSVFFVDENRRRSGGSIRMAQGSGISLDSAKKDPLRYFFISCSITDEEAGIVTANGWWKSESMPSHTFIRQLMFDQNKRPGHKLEDCIILSIHEFKDSVDYNRFMPQKLKK